MRPALFATPLLALLCADALAAPASRDVQALEACIATAEPGQRDTCIGTVANPCLDADTNTTAGMNACLGREYAVWDAWLNRDYTAYLAQLDPDGKALLKEVELLFIALKDKRCAFDYALNGGGTLHSTTAANCRMTETAHQWIWVKAHLDEIGQ